LTYTRKPISVAARCLDPRCFVRIYFKADYRKRDLQSLAISALKAHVYKKHPNRKGVVGYVAGQRVIR
jgi:hypothetical protein